MKDRGMASVEAAIAFPALALIALFLFAAMQVMTARSQVQAAARSGARAAATAGSFTDAQNRASNAVASAFAAGSSCGSSAVPHVSGFAAGASTTVEVTCSVDTVFSFVLGPRTVTGKASEYVSGILGGTN